MDHQLASAESQLVELYAVRRRVQKLLERHWPSVMHFAIEEQQAEPLRGSKRRIRGFANLTRSKPEPGSRVSLASTATCVRSLRLGNQRNWAHLDFEPLAAEIRRRFEEGTLTTAGLPSLNAFTLGQLVPIFGDIGIGRDESIWEACTERLRDLLLQPGVPLGEFPPNGYLSYWVLAAARAVDVAILPDSALVEWSRHEFDRQLALLSAQDEEESDAFQLAYNLVIQIAFNSAQLRPNVVAYALEQLKKVQLPRGVWEKKEPLFVWKDRGDAYCFSFELLTTLLSEFRKSYAELAPFDEAFKCSLAWVERNVHNDQFDRTSSWRSGHRTESKSPESWATAEVYAFLRRYERYLDFKITSSLLKKYRGSPGGVPSLDIFTRFYQPEVRSRTRSARTSSPLLGDVLRKVMLEPLRLHPNGPEYSLSFSSDSELRARSAILFGPPGTGKSSLVKSIARYLGWPVVVLDPSDFASEGLHSLPTTIGKIFSDLRETRDTVIFFDEMEELMRDRRSSLQGAGDSSFEQRLLTTALLPKLQDLHDRAQSLFFVATNHFPQIDEAARRFGRFDLILEVLPACLDEKVRQTIDGVAEAQATPGAEASETFVVELDSALKRLSTSADRGEERDKLEWATHGEMRNIVNVILAGQGKGQSAEQALLAALEQFEPSIKIDEWRENNRFNSTGSF
ncbi:ATP-binding protein [Amycolatopsis sp. NPDC004772]